MKKQKAKREATDVEKEYQMPPDVRARLLKDADYKPLADCLRKYKDTHNGDIYFLRHHESGHEEWIPMQGRKPNPKRRAKLPPIKASHEKGEALFDPEAYLISRPNHAMAS